MTLTLERPATVQHHYEPRGSAATLFGARDSEVLLSGPAGTGKSRACLEKANFLALSNPGCRGLMVRKTATSLTSTGLVTWREKVVPEGIRHGVLNFFGGSAQEAAGYRYANGSFVAVGGMDKPSKIMSSEYDFVYVQEATELTTDDWEAITTRLRNGVISFQQVIADCNPAQPTHWLKGRCDLGTTRELYSRHEDNPVLFGPDGMVTEVGSAYIAKLDALTGVRKERLRYGRWAAAEGLVYEDFDPAVHVVDRLPAGSAQWTRWWTVDFGYSNPFVLQCWAQDPDGRLWLYREIYMTKTLVEDHAKKILSVVRDAYGVWREPKPRAIICDHDAEDRATLERHLGMSTSPARKSVSDGIQATQARYKVQPDGKPRIFFVRDALLECDPALRDAKKPTCTLEEEVGYVWPQDVKPDKRENPVKEDDHGQDAKRYMVAEVDLGGRLRVRFI